MDINLRSIRQEYNKKGLLRKDIPNNPFILFQKWLQEAIDAQVNEPTAMIVGTVSPEGTPSTRTVLLKEFRDSKFVFYSNYESRKGQHLSQNNHISISFIWHELERQIHIEGIAEKLESNISDEYFQSRPYKSQIGARISPQSHPIDSRFQIMRKFIIESSKWIGKSIQRPDNWGGYAVTANRIEFWQGRPSRLHDRFLYQNKSDDKWTIHRIAP